MEFISGEYMPLILIALIAVAFIAGVVDSIAGGAGVILVPSFMLAGISPQFALGQEKAVSTLGTFAAIYNFNKSNKILWNAVGIGIVFALVGAYVGAHAILLFDEKTTGKVILFLLPVGLLLSLAPKREIVGDLPNKFGKKTLWIGVPLVTFSTGFYDGFFGPGTGSLLIICFHYFLKFDLVRASATSKIFNLSSNVGALVAFVIAGKILYMLALPLVVASIAGNYIGSRMAITKGESVIRKMLAASMVMLIGTMAYKYIF